MTIRPSHWRNDLINREPREATNKVLEMVDNGILNPRDALLMALKWMSEDDVKAMAEANELFEEDEEEVEIDTLYHDCSEEELRKMGCFGDDKEEEYEN